MIDFISHKVVIRVSIWFHIESIFYIVKRVTKEVYVIVTVIDSDQIFEIEMYEKKISARRD